jgi:hypothetical protein
MGKMKYACRTLNLKRSGQFDDPDVDERILKKYGVKLWMGFIWVRMRSSDEFL